MAEQFEMGPDGAPVADKKPSPQRRTGIGEDIDLLELFKQDMTEDLAENDVYFTHKYRPAYRMSFGTDLNDRQLRQWQRKAMNRDKSIDIMKVCAIVLANLSTGLWRDGVQMMDDGEPFTFRSRGFIDTFSDGDAVEAVQKFMAKDGYLQGTAEAVLTACGFADEVTPDPTDG